MGSEMCIRDRCKVLYSAGATVYIGARNEKLVRAAMDDITATKAASHAEGGQMKFLHVDLADLESVQRAAEVFKAQERKLDVLWNNAGLSLPPTGSKSAQGHELTTATNCLGPFLLTRLLLPQLEAAARHVSQTPDAKDTVRVVWTSSLLVDQVSPLGGVQMNLIDEPPQTWMARAAQYSASKAGNYFLASEFAKRYTERTGVISLTHNPGNLKTKVWRGTDAVTYALSYPLFTTRSWVRGP